jgi:hypothetical protein
MRDTPEGFCWPTSRENAHYAHTATIAFESEVVTAGVFPSPLELSRVGVQFTATDLIMPWLILHCQEFLLIEFNGFETCRSPGYGCSNVN